MVENVTDITQQMNNPHALNKLGFRLGFLGRLTDLVNTVGYEISSNYQGTGPKFIAKWEHSFVEAQAIVQHLGDCRLSPSFDKFKGKCEDYYLKPKWDDEQQNCMKHRQARLLEQIHEIQSRVIWRYLWTFAFVFALTASLVPLLIEHFPWLIEQLRLLN